MVGHYHCSNNNVQETGTSRLGYSHDIQHGVTKTFRNEDAIVILAMYCSAQNNPGPASAQVIEVRDGSTRIASIAFDGVATFNTEEMDVEAAADTPLNMRWDEGNFINVTKPNRWQGGYWFKRMVSG